MFQNKVIYLFQLSLSISNFFQKKLKTRVHLNYPLFNLQLYWTIKNQFRVFQRRKVFQFSRFHQRFFSLQTPLPRWLLYLLSHISCTFCEYRNRFSILKLELLLVKTKRWKKNEDGIKSVFDIFESFVQSVRFFFKSRAERRLNIIK